MTITQYRKEESHYQSRANRLLMTVKRSSDLEAIALVEGQADVATYKRLLLSRFPQRGSRLHFDWGPGLDGQEKMPKGDRNNRKKQVLHQTWALREKEKRNEHFNVPFFAIVDSDFDKDPCRGFDPGHCYFATDTNDLETLILFSDAFIYRFLGSLIGASRKELVLFLQQDGIARCQGLDLGKITDEEMREIAIELRSHLLKSAVFFGNLRLYNRKKGRFGGNLSFKSLQEELTPGAPKYIDQETASLDQDGVLDAVAEKDSKKVREDSKEYAESEELPEGLRSQGHDLVLFLLVALRRVVDRAKYEKCSATQFLSWQELKGGASAPLWKAVRGLEKYIQSSYSLEEFKETKLYGHLETWMEENMAAPS